MILIHSDRQADLKLLSTLCHQLGEEESPRTFFGNTSIPRVLIKIYWVIFSKLTGPSYSNYQLLNVSAREGTWWLAALYRKKWSAFYLFFVIFPFTSSIGCISGKAQLFFLWKSLRQKFNYKFLFGIPDSMMAIYLYSFFKKGNVLSSLQLKAFLALSYFELQLPRAEVT